MSSARCKSSCLLSQGNWQDSVSTKVDPGLNTTLNGSAISRTQLIGMSWEQDGKRIDISSGSSVHSYYLSPRGGGGVEDFGEDRMVLEEWISRRQLSMREDYGKFMLINC